MMQELTGKPNLPEAIRMLGFFTNGRYDVWMLAGSHNGANRAIVLSHLTGIRQPQSKAGVAALREALYSALNVTGNCLAAKEDDFLAKVKATMNPSNLAIVAVHGESGSIFHVVDPEASEDDQPAILASYSTRDAAIRAMAVTRGN